jgi:hypothetical protein
MKTAAYRLTLPPVKSVLGIDSSSIPSVSLSQVTGLLKIASGDIGKMIDYINTQDWKDAGELGIEEVLEVASLAGVPGVGIAATLAPYLFDMLNAGILGHGSVSPQMFIDGMAHAQSNIGKFLDSVSKGDYVTAANIAIDDALDIAGAFIGGPYAVIAKLLVNITFAIIKASGLGMAFNQFIMDVIALPQQIDDALHGKYPEWGPYIFSPINGWVLKETK